MGEFNLHKYSSTITTLLGVIGGISIGFILKSLKEVWPERSIMFIKFPGELFLNSINALLLPLITSSIISASSNLSKSGRIGIATFFYYLTTTTLGIILSIFLVETIRPGELNKNEFNSTEFGKKTFLTIDTILDLLRNLIPENLINACIYQYQTILIPPENSTQEPINKWKISHQYASGTNILGLVFFSILLGLALGTNENKGIAGLKIFHSISDITMKLMSTLTKIAPVALLFLISGRILEVDDFGFIVQRLGIYILTVLTGLLIQGFIVLPLLYFLITYQSPYKIILRMKPAFLTAIGTSSSTATVPMTLKCLDKVGINPTISKFVVPLGATINMDGIALYETIGAIFIIQLRNLHFSLSKIIAISITCTISCIGAAGLPNGGYVMLILVLNSIGVPVEDVSLIIVIDCFIDRFRTMINIIADALGSGIIAHFNPTN